MSKKRSKQTLPNWQVMVAVSLVALAVLFFLTTFTTEFVGQAAHQVPNDAFEQGQSGIHEISFNDETNQLTLIIGANIVQDFTAYDLVLTYPETVFTLNEPVIGMFSEVEDDETIISSLTNINGQLTFGYGSLNPLDAVNGPVKLAEIKFTLAEDEFYEDYIDSIHIDSLNVWNLEINQQDLVTEEIVQLNDKIDFADLACGNVIGRLCDPNSNQGNLVCTHIITNQPNVCLPQSCQTVYENLFNKPGERTCSETAPCTNSQTCLQDPTNPETDKVCININTDLFNVYDECNGIANLCKSKYELTARTTETVCSQDQGDCRSGDDTLKNKYCTSGLVCIQESDDVFTCNDCTEDNQCDGDLVCRNTKCIEPDTRVDVPDIDNDLDNDGILNDDDNCRNVANGPDRGVCDDDFTTPCFNNAGCTGTCILTQLDSDSDLIGDVCDSCPDDPDNNCESGNGLCRFSADGTCDEKQEIAKRLTAIVNGECYPDSTVDNALYCDENDNPTIEYDNDELDLANKIKMINEMGIALGEFFTEVGK
jgi:hypothetical protein